MGPELFPVLPLRDAVLFPPLTVGFTVSRAGSRAAVEAADTGLVVCVAQVADAEDEPTVADLYSVGTLARIKKVRERGAHLEVTVTALERLRARGFTRSGSFMQAEVVPMRTPDAAEDATADMDFLAGRLVGRIETQAEMNTEQQFLFNSVRDHGKLADVIAWFADLDVSSKQTLLETVSTQDRLVKLLELTNPALVRGDGWKNTGTRGGSRGTSGAVAT